MVRGRGIERHSLIFRPKGINANIGLMGSQVVLVVKNLPVTARDTRDPRDLGSIPGLRSSPGEGHGNPLQYSCHGNTMDRGAWRATVHELQRVGHN